MFFKKIESEGLAHYSYIVIDGDEAFVIDPKRDIDSYIDIADSMCSKISYVFETHRNEDYLIGSIELQRLTNCKIIHGNLDFGYGEITSEGSTFKIGGLKLGVIQTPGHSPESLSYVLYPGRNPWGVFTGDTLFYGSIGRTDLLGKNKTEECTSAIYDSIHNKIINLGGNVLIFPGHGPGTLCGNAIADIPMSTIGFELKINPMLNLSKEKFIELKKKEDIPLPPYFSKMSKDNLKGPDLYNVERIEPLNVSSFEKMMNNCIVLDTRSPQSFASGHITGSYNIWLDGLVNFAGWILDYDKDILLITERQVDTEIVRKNLMRIGFDRIRGYLCEGIRDWQNIGKTLEQSGIETVDNLYKKEKKDLFLLDVRDKKEFKSGHISQANNIYIGDLENRLKEVPLNRPIISICSIGNRAGIGASILKRHGYNVFNLLGGMSAWNEKGYPIKKE